MSQQEQLQLQISLTIGTQRYLIRVPKQTNLTQLIRQFLRDNKLNPKYQSSILGLVKDKLAAAQEEQIHSHKQAERKSPFKKTVKTQHSTEDTKNKKAKGQTVNNHKNKEDLNSKVEKGIDGSNGTNGKDRDVSPDSRRLYEQWKQKEKQKNKNLQRKSPIQKKQSRTWVPPNKERHSPDYFYRKGLDFKQECKRNDENSFKKLYPFKIKDLSLSQQQQNQLYSRLYSGRELQSKRHCPKEYQNQTLSQKQRIVDPIKQYIKKQDSKIDREIFKMIKDGSLSFMQKQRSVSKSPFRKTILN